MNSENNMDGGDGMIYATLDDELTTITITSPTHEPGIQAFDKYLDVLRKIIRDDQDEAVVLDALEMFLYRLRKAMWYSNNLPWPNNPKNKGSAEVPIIEAFYNARVLQVAMRLAPENSIEYEHKKAVAMLIEAIDETLMSISPRKYAVIIGAEQGEASFMYSEYLEYLYMHFSATMDEVAKKAYIMLIFKQIMRTKEYDPKEKDMLAQYRIREYHAFNQYCADWLLKSNEDRIYLEDILEDMGFEVNL